MQTVSTQLDYPPTILDFGPLTLTDEQFESLARNHRDMNIELSAEGELIIVAPTLPNTGHQNANLNFDLTLWARRDGTGVVFDSSSLFTFPNGAKRSPDAAWVKRDKWDALSDSEKKRFSRLVPDFVIELRSLSDNLSTLQDKMAEYISNGVRLGWLIDLLTKQVHIYEGDGKIIILDDPEIVLGGEVLPGFELNVREIW